MEGEGTRVDEKEEEGEGEIVRLVTRMIYMYLELFFFLIFLKILTLPIDDLNSVNKAGN